MIRVQLTLTHAKFAVKPEPAKPLMHSALPDGLWPRRNTPSGRHCRGQS